MSAPSAMVCRVVGCLLVAGLPVLWLIGGGTRSASCSSALNSRSRDASLSGLDGSFQEWWCGSGGRSWRFWAVGWSAVMRRFFAVVVLIVFARGLVRTRGGVAWRPSRGLAASPSTFEAGAPSTRISCGCHRAPVGRLRPANGLLALLRQLRRSRRAPRWPRTPGKAKLSEPHGARRARSFRAHRRHA